MTILTKSAISEKKSDKLEVPLVESEKLPATGPPPSDVESQWPQRIIIFPNGVRARRVSASTTLWLLVIALAVVSIGIIGGKILYNEYFSVTRGRSLSDPFMLPSRMQGQAQIPLTGNDDDIDDDDNDLEKMPDLNVMKWNDKELQNILTRNFLQENYEVDDTKKYEKLDVPDFRDGRNGRFIHDFNTNVTGIIDVTGNRCFIMPLNRDTVLPPKSLLDLFRKMSEGYYKVDTKVVRDTMRIVTPPVTDMSTVGPYIANECNDMPIYKLEKYVGGVVKRSADLHSTAKFAHFSGKGINEFDIMNIDEIVEYEEQQKNSH